MAAGLVPFVGLSAWFWFDSSALGLQLLNLYSFGITSFLMGTWWQPLGGDSRVFGAVAGNGIFLLAVGSLAWLPDFFPLISAVLLLLIYILEQHTPWVSLRQKEYGRLRLVVTLIASGCLFLAHLRI